jgi:hypothetical protein
MAWSDWPVPFRSDRRCGTLDQMRSGWIRSTDTSSLSDLILVTGSRSDGRKEVGGGMLTVVVSSGDVRYRWSSAVMLR